MIIATHNGPFHADDVFAIAILKLIYPDAEVIRTRDETLLTQADMRVDVGVKYDPSTNDFDHHQGAPLRENGIPYASAGLVWKHYGEQLIDKELLDRIDKRLFQGMDATDNGVAFPLLNDSIEPYTMSSMVDAFNPQWNENQAQDHFSQAVELAQRIIKREIIRVQSHQAADNIVREALQKYEDEEYFVLEQYVPWKKIAIDESDKLFCVHPGTDGNWNAVAVTVKSGSFENRLDFPKAWAGFRDEELAKASGVQDAVFSHYNRFICVAKSREGAIKFVKQALLSQEEHNTK